MKFEIVFLDEAFAFLKGLNIKVSKKVLDNIWKSAHKNDSELFKKLQDNIWEFRTLYNGMHYRLFAFWDKTDKSNTLVISTHGIIKKTAKVSKSEIEKAKKIRINYFNEKRI